MKMEEKKRGKDRGRSEGNMRELRDGPTRTIRQGVSLFFHSSTDGRLNQGPDLCPRVIFPT